MKFVVKFFLAAVVVASLVIAVVLPQLPPAAPPVAVGPPVVMEVLDPSLRYVAGMWQAEIGRRFPRAVGVLCHGGNHIAGQWDTSAISFGRVTTIGQVVHAMQARYPGRTVVLLTCNPGHLKLNIPGVYYAHSNVWCVPDRNYDPGLLGGSLTIGPPPPLPIVKPAKPAVPSIFPMLPFPALEPLRSGENPDAIGNIFEFITD